ncbi:hypothetical protein ACGFIE_07735 [Micromonospora sp. NPDC049275]|uniref:hypothetical protein n=1 Tax=Micromonospora sp. NPDC049275 TaxID=3364268 RepID=UPI00372438E5
MPTPYPGAAPRNRAVLGRVPSDDRHAETAVPARRCRVPATGSSAAGRPMPRHCATLSGR